jgi:hypothetical protein
VTISGENFTGTSRVLFGDVPAASVTVDLFNRLVAVTPPHAPGGYDVRVVTAGGTSPQVDPDAFTFVAPPVVAGAASSSNPPATKTTAAKPKPKPKTKHPKKG